ncbi:MAG TPA: hypothetical protein VEX68_15925 [Bryobacteraceae bacterium]|nr:hypothetical protein [Bryobacteraceae bacterium]
MTCWIVATSVTKPSSSVEAEHRTTGWQHSESVIRSLACWVLDFGPEQQINHYALADPCYSSNGEQVSNIFPRMTWIGLRNRLILPFHEPS